MILKAERMHDPGFMKMVIRVCCALHNVCQRMNDNPNAEWADPEHVLAASRL
jgi:hypothetical protein